MDKVTENISDYKETPFYRRILQLIETDYKIYPKIGKEPYRIKEGELNKFRERPINQASAEYYFSDFATQNTGVGLLTGDHVECVDFEGKFQHYNEVHDYIKFSYTDIYDKLVIEETANGNPHWLYKCVQTGGKEKLAQREPTPDEIVQGERKVLLIELLGERQQVNIFPSPGYKQVKDDLVGMEYITPEQRSILLNILRSYCDLLKPEVTGGDKKQQGDPKAVWNVFNSKHDYKWIEEVLIDAGWTIGRETEQRISVKRPGQTTANTSGSILKEKNLLYLFSTSTEFPADKPLSPFDIMRYLKYDGNFDLCAQSLADQGYGRFNPFRVIEISLFDVTISKKGTALSVNRGRFLAFLHAAGVGLYFIGKVPLLIKLTDHTFEEASIEQLKKLVQSHINSLPETFDCGITRLDLLEFIYKGSDNYFGKGFIEWINHFIPNFLQDDKDTGYIQFNNGVMCVSAAGAVLKSYSELNKHTWKNHVIDFNITYDKVSPFESVWHRFMCCVCGNPDQAKFTQDQSEKLFYLQCVTGYLIHKYKDPSRPFAIILAEETQSDDKGGGTGKGIFVFGIGKVNSLCTIPGKKFNPADKFAFQRIEPFHRLAAIDDVPPKFPFEALYNTLTEGLSSERKGLQEIFIPYENSPKIIVITNFVISSTGDHAKRRQRIFEFAPLFNPKYTPEQHFGHILFRDWDPAEWNRFYNLQVHCLQQYLIHGLPDRGKSDILKRREIRQRYGSELEAWFFEQYYTNGCEDFKGVTELYTDFLSHANMEKTDYSMKKFSNGIRSATLSIGDEMVSDRQSTLSEPEGKKQKVNVVKIVKQSSGQDRGG